ncbi:MAG: DinB family protein [Bacteroidota bacterium]
MTLIEDLSQIYTRELDSLKKEICAYNQEQDLWKKAGEINNSAGHLVLHLIGNLNHFIGTHIGKTGYQRARAREFSSQDIPREELLLQIDQTKEMIQSTLAQLSWEDLEQGYPEEWRQQKRSLRFMLIHLIAHLNYHLGQINYHRRLIHS